MRIEIPVLAGLVSVGLAAALTPIVRMVALRAGLVDQPSERRVHSTPIPRMGGIAIFCAFGITLALMYSIGVLTVNEPLRRPVLGFTAGALVIFVAGLYDDMRGLGAKKKLSAQLLSATLAWYGGAQIQEAINVPGFGLLTIGPVVAYLATVLWIVAFTNAINLIDGLDGLAGGVVFFAALTNIVVALITGNYLAAAMNSALAGAVLGFLFYNFNPARIFMGDTGSLFLGYALSTGALLFSRQKESTLASLLVLVIALGLPLTDTILSMVRRIIQRRSIFSADRGHLHHRLLALGLTHRRAVLVLYGCTIALCGTSIAAAIGQDWQVGLALVGAIVVLAGVVRFSGFFSEAIAARSTSRDEFHPVAYGMAQRMGITSPRIESAACIEDLYFELEELFAQVGARSASLSTQGKLEPEWSWTASRLDARIEGRCVELKFPLHTSDEATQVLLLVSVQIPAGRIPRELQMMGCLLGDLLVQAGTRLQAWK